MPNLKLIWTNDNPKKPRMPDGPYNFIDFWGPFIIFFLFSCFVLFFFENDWQTLLFIIWIEVYFYKRGIGYVNKTNFKHDEED